MEFPNKRKQILDTAATLFYEKGVKEVGIDEIIRSANVAKMTLYKNFSSKDQLIAEVMKEISSDWISWFEENTNLQEQSESDPYKEVLFILNIIEKWFRKDSFHKCPFSSIAIEIGNSEHPAYPACLQPMYHVESYLTSRLNHLPEPSRSELIDQIRVLVKGCLLTANLEGPNKAIESVYTAKKIAANITKTNYS